MARRPRAIFCLWTGEHFEPSKSFKASCERDFVVGSVYPLAVVEERSASSHSHYFAGLAEGFNNLSEENSKRFPDSEYLRHWCLVQLGYCTETNYALANGKEARKLAADIRRMSRYAVIKINDDTVTVWEAESQSKAAMKSEMFQRSKQDVLDMVASMSRTTRQQLEKESRHHGR